MPTRKRQANKRKVQEPVKEAVETKKEKLGMRFLYSYKFFCITIVNHIMSVSSAIEAMVVVYVRYTCFKISKIMEVISYFECDFIEGKTGGKIQMGETRMSYKFQNHRRQLSVINCI